ncbi:MAG: PilZ domain-containing protein [Deltaproteobacteria bacterium]|nr:PilZ domain-containing protein [Deltaproteobacteria bacterium]
MENNHRTFSRIEFDCLATLTNGSRQFQCKVLDISLKGVLLEKPDGWQEGSPEKWDIKVILDDSDVVISMEAKVAHTDPHRLGFLCTSIDLDSMVHLRRLMEWNTGDSSLVERELKAMV